MMQVGAGVACVCEYVHVVRVLRCRERANHECWQRRYTHFEENGERTGDGPLHLRAEHLAAEEGLSRHDNGGLRRVWWDRFG
jgi:hypothetical protein